MTLPVTASIAAVIWAVIIVLGKEELVDVLFLGIMSGIACWLMATLNNRYALMRTYSRIASSAVLILILSCLSKLDYFFFWGVFTSCLLLGAYHLLFATYQDKQAVGQTFAGFALLGLAIFISPHILFFVPILWLLLSTSIASLCLRTFVASLLGLALPFWLLLPISVLTEHNIWANWWEQATNFTPLAALYWLTTDAWIHIGFVTLLYLTGTIHFLRNSHTESIKTRMFYQVFITMGACTLVFILLQPHRYTDLLPLFIVNTAPLIAHYITFTRTRLTNLSFIAMVVVAVMLITHSLWTLL